MIPEEILKGAIQEYCIACLTKSPDMYYLNEQVEKRSMFARVFSVELENYGALPQFLCYVCDIKLNSTHNFQESVRQYLTVLQEYNEKLMVNSIEKVKEEEIDEEYNELKIEINKFGSEEESVQLKEEVQQMVPDINIGSPKEVNMVAEFTNQHYEVKTCILCGFIAANREAIVSHMVIFHKDKKNNLCLECKENFVNYKENNVTHNGKYSCPFCDKNLNISHCVEQLQNHSGTAIPVCHKALKSATWLKKHKCIHTNDKPFSCPNCSKCFVQLSSLRYHVVTHGNFPCDSCEKRYKSAEELKAHECVAMEKLPSVNEVWINADDGTETQSEEVENEAIVITGCEPVGSDVDYEELSPSQDPIATDDRSPSEEPGVSGVIKKSSTKIIHGGQRLMAFNFYTSIKNQGLSKSKSVALTASRTGISERTVWKIIRDVEISGMVQSPSNKKKRADMFNKLGEEQRKTLRAIVHSFLLRNEAPTLLKLKKAVEDEETLPSMKATTLWQTLRKMGIAWERRGATRVLLEKPEVVL